MTTVESILRGEVKKLEDQLEIYRLPSPERLSLLERLAKAQHNLLVMLDEPLRNA